MIPTMRYGVGVWPLGVEGICEGRAEARRQGLRPTMTFWQEIGFGLSILLIGLWLELLIDIWRDRYKVTRRKAGDDRHSS